jgi:hypothetical protein
MAYSPYFGSLSRDAHLAKVVALYRPETADVRGGLFALSIGYYSVREGLNYDFFKIDFSVNYNFRGLMKANYTR